MEEKKKDYYSLKDIGDNIRALFQYLRKKVWLMALCVIAGALIGVGYYFLQQPKYEAATTFILEEKSSGGGGIAGLASQFGLNIGSLGSGGSIFSGDNILDILKSKKVVQQVLVSEVDQKADNRTLADLYLDFTGTSGKWKKNSRLSGINFANTSKGMTPVQDSILNEVYAAIVKKNLYTDRTSKQGTIIKVRAVSANPVFSRLMVERVVAEASKLYLDIRTGTAQANINEMQNRSDSLLSLLNNKSYRAAASQQLDINPGIKTAIVPTEIATRDKTVLATLYAEVTKNLEAAKLILSQQTPVIQVLDRPGILLDDNKKGLFGLVVVAAVIAAVVFFMGALVIFLLSKINAA